MTQVAMGLGEFGGEAEGLLVVADRLLQPALVIQGVAEVDVGLGVLGVEAEGLLVVADL
jgi:hypothetical protein